jgi:hypothetical protein
MNWHFTPQPAALPIAEFRERYDHLNKPEKMEIIHGKLFGDDTQRFHVIGMLIESLDTKAVKHFIYQHRATQLIIPLTMNSTLPALNLAINTMTMI